MKTSSSLASTIGAQRRDEVAMRKTAGLWSLLVRVLPAVGVFLVSFVFRFNTLAGQLGGFENDEFLVVSRGQQILLGDMPSRDFVDPGYPLAYFASAAAQALFGGTLAGHAVLAVAMLAVGAALTGVLATKASGSLAAGLFVALLQIAIGPRFYNYPKVVAYAVAVLAWWRYVDAPTQGRLFAIAAWTAVAFLFRHDHGAYIGIATVAVLAVQARESGVVGTVRTAVVYGAFVGLCLSPYLVFLQMNGGVVEHLRGGAAFSRRDTARTQFRYPAFDLSDVRLIARPSVSVGAAPRINARWSTTLSEAERLERERRYSLWPREWLHDLVWNYEIEDVSAQNLAALVRDPAVVDTHGIDRQTLRLSSPSGTSERPPSPAVLVLSGLLTERNVLAWLYHLFVAIPFVAVAGLVLTGRTSGDRRDGFREVPKLVPVIVLAVILNVQFLRGTLDARLPDCSVPIGVLGAWLLTALPGPRMAPCRSMRVTAFTVVAAILLATVTTVLALGEVGPQLTKATDGSGMAGLVSRSREVFEALRQPAPVMARTDADQSATMRLADYLHECTGPDNRVLILAYVPEVFFFAQRGFAGGHVDVRPGYSNGVRDQRLTLSRLRTESVPIVITESQQLYDEDYRPDWPLVADHLERAYREAAAADFGQGRTFRVLVRHDLSPIGIYQPLRLPCFR